MIPTTRHTSRPCARGWWTSCRTRPAASSGISSSRFGTKANAARGSWCRSSRREPSALATPPPQQGAESSEAVVPAAAAASMEASNDHSDDEPYVTSRPPRLTRVSEGDETAGSTLSSVFSRSAKFLGGLVESMSGGISGAISASASGWHYTTLRTNTLTSGCIASIFSTVLIKCCCSPREYVHRRLMPNGPCSTVLLRCSVKQAVQHCYCNVASYCKEAVEH